MSRARFTFAAHPDAIADLRELPDGIRDLALLELQNLVHGSDDCLPLKGRLAGLQGVRRPLRRLPDGHPVPPGPADLDSQARDLPRRRGSRKDYAVYRAAQLRTGPQQNVGPDSATEARVQAARSRSSLTADRPTAGQGAPLPTASSPATAPRKVPQQ